MGNSKIRNHDEYGQNKTIFVNEFSMCKYLTNSHIRNHD